MEVDDGNSGPDETYEDIFKAKILSVYNELRSDSSKTVFKALHYVRLNVIERPKGVSYLYECGGTKAFYKILTSSNTEVLNLALNILGNICVVLVSNEGFCDEMIKYEVGSRLTALLRKTNDKKLQRRICRLVGNMAQCHALGRDLHKSNITVAINNVLGTTDCSEVKLMGLRAMRWLWETDKSQIVRVEAVKTVAGFLEVEDKQLFKLVIRTLVVFTQPCMSKVAQQIRGPSGNGYNLILSKISESSVNVLILNLSHSPEARVELCKAGAVQEIVQKISNKIDSYLITALCIMCREPMVRASLRKTPDGFKTLLALLVNPKTKHFYPELLNAVSQFNYDTPSLLTMVKGGLIGVLVEKLGEYSKVHGEPHFEAIPQMAPPLSPSSPSSSRGSLSPQPSYYKNDRAMYSPRCSTPESDSPATPLSKSTWSSHENSSEMDSCILEVLCQLTYQGTPLPALASKTTITTFLNYIVGLRYPQSRQNFLKATKALSSIVKCKNYFNMILEEESIIDIEKYLCRTLHSDCYECKRLEETGRSVLGELGTAAQSGLGEGELTYRLTTTSSETIKTNISLILPHVIEQPNLLTTLLFGHNALRILLNALRTRTEDAVASLHRLFTTLSIINPQETVQGCTHCEVSGMRKESNISFQLDDGSIVHANRESLSHGCPMFEAMFRGGFKESQQATVQITDMSSECLSHLTRVIDEYCVCALPKDHITLLEMVTASDRFLLPDLTSKILSNAMNTALTYATTADIFEWGVTAGQNLSVAEDVPLHVVKFIMGAEMPAAYRVHAIKGIFEGKSSDEFCRITTDIIRSSLKTYSRTYKFSSHRMYY